MEDHKRFSKSDQESLIESLKLKSVCERVEIPASSMCSLYCVSGTINVYLSENTTFKVMRVGDKSISLRSYDPVKYYYSNDPDRIYSTKANAIVRVTIPKLIKIIN